MRNNIAIITKCLTRGGLQRCAANMSYALKFLGYNVNFILTENIKDITYEYYGNIFYFSLDKENSINILDKSLLIFDFDWLNYKNEYYAVNYALGRYPHKFICTIHEERNCIKYFNLRLSNLILKSINQFHSIICVSNIIYNKFISEFNTHYNICTLENYVNIPNILFSKKFEFEYILFVGRINDPVKGLWNLIQAFIKSDTGNNIFLLIAGDGNLSDTQQKIVNNYRNIKILGMRDDIFELMKFANFVVISSESEGFGYVLVESIKIGTPVITKKIGVAGDIIIHKENGYLINTNSVEDLRSAINYMLINYKHMKNNCSLQNYTDNYSLHRYCTKLKKIIDSRCI